MHEENKAMMCNCDCEHCNMAHGEDHMQHDQDKMCTCDCEKCKMAHGDKSDHQEDSM